MAIGTGAALLGGAAISGIGGILGANEQRKAQQDALAAQNVNLAPFSVFGPGGLSTSFGQADPRAAFGPGAAPITFQDLAGSAGGGVAGGFGGAPGAQAPAGGGLPSFITRPDGTSFTGANAPLGNIESQLAGGAFPGLQDFATQGASINLGQLEPSRQGLVNLAQQQIGRAGLQGIPQAVQQAANQQANFGGPAAQAFPLQALQAGALNQFGQSLGETNFRRGQALQDFSGLQQQTLDTLRQQAQPFEQRAFQNLQDQQFATGRGGTTGGGLQTEAFARGLGQADLSRQLAATGEARATQSLQDQLLQSAFGRFGQTAGLGSDINQQLFGRGAGLNELGFQRGQQNLQNQIGLAGLAPQLQQQQLAPALAALQAQGALGQQGLAQAQFGLNTGVAQANALLGAGSNIASIAGGQNFGASPFSALGDVGAGLFGLASRSPAGQDILGGIFG